MNENRRFTPRSKIEEIKALRNLPIYRPKSGKKELNLTTSLTTTINQILANSERTSTNNTLIISKPSMALKGLSKNSGPRNPRIYRANQNLNYTTASVNKSLNSSGETSSRIPKAPPKPSSFQYVRKVSTANTPKEVTDTVAVNLPITPSIALRTYKADFTNYEIGEVLDYPEVYY